MYLMFLVLGVCFGKGLVDFSGKRDDFSVEIKQLSPIDPDSQCFQASIGNMIQKCQNIGVEAFVLEERKQAALKLTICEMRNLRLYPPVSCSHLVEPDHFNGCIQEMEKVPQYWTMFSGNYREIEKICYEKSLPYEKSQIVSLYGNITEVFKKLYENAKKSMDDDEKRLRVMEKKFGHVFEMFQRLIDDFLSTQNTVMVKVEDSAIEVKETLETSLKLLQSFRDVTFGEVDEIAVNLNFLSLQIRDVTTLFTETKLREEMELLTSDVEQNIQKVSSLVNDAVDNGKEQLKNLESMVEIHDSQGKKLQNTLKGADELASRINNLLSNIEIKALSQREALTFDTEYITQFLNELLFGLETSFTQVENRIDNYLSVIDDRVDNTLKRLDQVDERVDKIYYFFLSVSGGFGKVYEMAAKINVMSFSRSSTESVLFYLTNTFNYIKTVSDSILTGVKMVMILFCSLYVAFSIPKRLKHPQKRNHPPQKRQKLPLFKNHSQNHLHSSHYTFVHYLIISILLMSCTYTTYHVNSSHIVEKLCRDTKKTTLSIVG